MNSRLATIFLLLLAVFAVACSNTASPEAQAPTSTAILLTTPIQTQTSVPSPTAVPSPTLTPTVSASSTQTGSQEASPTVIPTATPVPARPTSTPISGASYGGTLNISSRENIAHQDVQQEISPALSTWGPGIAYSRLLRFKSGPDIVLPSLAVECDLCEKWTMIDSLTFDFELRDDVRWQDIQPANGRSLTPDDIVFSYERQRQTGWPNAPLLHAIQNITAISSDTVRLSLSIPDADFMIGLADGHSKIVAREVVEANGDLKKGPTVGTGPWILTRTQVEGTHGFERNPDYFEEDLPFLGFLNINVIGDETTRQAAFRVRSLDIQQMEPREWEGFQQRNPDMPFLLSRESASGVELALKTTVPPFDDIRVRKSVFLAIDPWASIRDVWGDAAYVSLGFPSVAADWLLPENELRQFFSDPQMARELLQDAQVPRPLPVSIKVGDFGDAYVEHGRRVADEMRAVGFDPTVEIVNRRDFGEQVWLGGNYEIFVGPIAPITSPNGYFLPVLHSRGQWNTAGYRDAELDAMIERQAQEFDPIARKELVRDIQRRVFSNAYRFMPATRVSIWAWWPIVQNFHPNFAGSEYSHWSRVWLR